QGFQFMIPANFVYENGIRIDVSDPLNPGPFVPYDQALDAIKAILDEGAADLAAAGTGAFPFALTRGSTGFDTNDGLRRVNRASAARLNAYRKDWPGVLVALEASYMSLYGPLDLGPSHPSGAAPDAFYPLYYV